VNPAAARRVGFRAGGRSPGPPRRRFPVPPRPSGLSFAPMPMIRRLRAVSFLAYRALVAHPLSLLTSRAHERGKARFLANYAPDGLVPLTPAEREALPRAMRCVGCGLCDAVCPLAGKLPAREFQGPSVVALAWSRATPELGHVEASLRRLPMDCGTCRRCEEICPREVPLRELFEFANRKLDEVRAAAGRPA
jgi:ferredoxin